MTEQPVVGSFYKCGDEILKCMKVRPTGCNTFHVVDDEGTQLVLYDEKLKGLIIDHGIRIIHDPKYELKLIIKQEKQ
jgi:hypothetical protein